jgi:hypothetical protein
MEIVAALVTGVLVAFATAFFTSRFYVHRARADLEKEFQGRFNERRWDVYSQFAEILLDLIHSDRSQALDVQAAAVGERLRAFIGRVWLVGSDDVIRGIIAWRKSSQGQTVMVRGTSGLVALANVLVAMRRDLGDTNTRMTGRDILSIIIEDIEKYVDEKGRLTFKEPG